MDNLDKGKLFGGLSELWYAVKKPVPKTTDVEVTTEGDKVMIQKASGIKKYLPYILGALALGLLYYFLAKKK